MSTANRRALRHVWLLAGLILLSQTACRRDDAGSNQPAAEPVAAVQAMTRALADNDLQAYARLSVPPAQYAQLQQAWAEGQSRWPLTELPLHDQLLPMLQALSADDGGSRLQRSFDAQLAGQTTAVRQAARSMGGFGVQYLQHETTYTPSQQAHYIQVVQTLASWAGEAPISDRARAKASISALTEAARAVGITDEQQLQALGMEPSLQRIAPFLGSFKSVLASYGLDLDQSLRELTGEVISQEGDNALLRLHYPLAGKTISLQIPVSRRDGHWYLTRTLADTDALLRHAQQARDAAVADSNENAAAAESPSAEP